MKKEKEKFIRDITTVGIMSKSEAKERLDKIIKIEQERIINIIEDDIDSDEIPF